MCVRLRGLRRHGRGVLPRQAGAADRALGTLDRRLQSLQLSGQRARFAFQGGPWRTVDTPSMYRDGRPAFPSLAVASDGRVGIAVTDFGGKVYTSDSARWNAEAIAIKQGRVVFVGSRRDAMAYRGDSTQVEDVNGATVVAGIVDAHAHVVTLGLRGIDIMGTQTYDEIVQAIAERAKTTPKGEWILGRGWDQNDWPEKAFPTHLCSRWQLALR